MSPYRFLGLISFFPQFFKPKPQFFTLITTISCGDLSCQLPYPMNMKNEHTDKQPQYEIQIAEQLDGRWQEWFDGLTITSTAGGHTLLVGLIQDQAALHGVLKKINNLGLTLISVNPQKETNDE